MKRKILNNIITLLAVVGIVFIIGGVGKADYMSEIGEVYSIMDCICTMLFGLLLIVPAIIREGM